MIEQHARLCAVDLPTHASAGSGAPRISPALPCAMSQNRCGSRPWRRRPSARSSTMLLAARATRSAASGLYFRNCATTGRRARTRSSATSYAANMVISVLKGTPFADDLSGWATPSRPIRAGPVTNGHAGARGLPRRFAHVFAVRCGGATSRSSTARRPRRSPTIVVEIGMTVGLGVVLRSVRHAERAVRDIDRVGAVFADAPPGSP